jgi:hypothetical protein
MSVVQFWVITALIAGAAAGLVMLLFTPHKTEEPPPIPAPVENKQAPNPVPEEDKQQRWVCSHTTRQTVTILTAPSGAFQAYMDQCDEWKLK